ncbi:hypothetical protein [Hyphobacterium sp.]|uniref:hypothetical protein n=1 Tax=Hyphobacterium sp. TaxID=2004662 RepID=UPI003BAC04E4
MLSVSAALLLLSSLQPFHGAALADQAERVNTLLAPRIADAQNQPASTAMQADADDPLLTGLGEFSRLAMRLSLQMEAEDGPEDLRCIYRGMAQDALNHRTTLETATFQAEQLTAYSDIRYLMDHARQIGPIADQPDIEPFTGVAPDCPRGPLR